MDGLGANMGRTWRQHGANRRPAGGYRGQHQAATGANLRRHRANMPQPVGCVGQHTAKIGWTWAKIGQTPAKMLANIGPTSATPTTNNNKNNNNHNTNTNTNINNNNNQQQQQARRRPNTTTTPARADGSAFAGARLSGVSLINSAPPAPHEWLAPRASQSD